MNLLCYARLAEISSKDLFKEVLETQLERMGDRLSKSLDSTGLG